MQFEDSRVAKDPAAMPLARWSYDLEPMAITITEVRKPLYRFLTSVCAIVGGVFTVVGLLDSLLHWLLHSIGFKRGIGKQS